MNSTMIAVLKKNKELRKELKRTHRIYKILLLICFIIIGYQHFACQANDVPKNTEMTIISSGDIEQLDTNTYLIHN